ncbi:hypothetical protein AWENTII_004285 [Aspergillus wentii]
MAPVFFTSTPPVVHGNTIIVAATHPSIETGAQNRDGSFLSDFYAFNYLFKGLGLEQTWLTAAAPETLLEKHEPYYYSNPYEHCREVLSRALLDNHELTPVAVVESSEMIDRFLSEAQTASERAKRENASVLLLAFCHGLPNTELLLNCGNLNKG